MTDDEIVESFSENENIIGVTNWKDCLKERLTKQSLKAEVSIVVEKPGITMEKKIKILTEQALFLAKHKLTEQSLDALYRAEQYAVQIYQQTDDDAAIRACKGEILKVQ